MSEEDKPEFWVCNISDKNVNLSDLRVTIPARAGVNLLDLNHFHYTYEQLKESAKSGSIFKKNKYIKVGKGPPEKDPGVQKTISKFPATRMKRSAVKIEKNPFEENFADQFFMSDEQFAAEMAEDIDSELE